jgi:hypothetical protein
MVIAAIPRQELCTFFRTPSMGECHVLLVRRNLSMVDDSWIDVFSLPKVYKSRWSLEDLETMFFALFMIARTINQPLLHDRQRRSGGS